MDKITDLTSKWYHYVGLDHHKDRDCHFYVEKKWSYGEPPVYIAYHNGYVAHDWHSAAYPTAAEAEEALAKWLTHTINGRIMNIKENIANPDKQWGPSFQELTEQLDALEGR